MDIAKIKELIEIFDNSTLTKLKYEDEKIKIHLDKTATQQVPVKVEPEIKVQKIEAKPDCEIESEVEIISSPMVGTFYQAPSPDSPPFVRVGDKVKKGQTLCIIEAMKIMNELEAEFDCEILEVLVEDGEPVEFDTPLFKVKRLS
jgi:acetyl-CoA carboxylase biotin carboxyl carrier protein